MSNHYCVFHRGININGVRIKMKDLAQVFIKMGYQDVKTILASGNVIITTDKTHMSKEDHKAKIEMQLSLYFGYEAYVILMDFDEIKSVLEEADTHVIPDGCHHYLLLTNDSCLPTELLTLFNSFKHDNNESLIKEPFGTYWIVPKGQTLQCEFGKKVLSKKTYKSRLTSRNINTIVKVYTELLKRQDNNQ